MESKREREQKKEREISGFSSNMGRPWKSPFPFSQEKKPNRLKTDDFSWIHWRTEVTGLMASTEMEK